ncbi:putative peptide chain release factor [Babesia sp. Xinjiang]|uniref:putative peptide chain release factor n=1 Tax=Babesia sp. Xinjiang TaxID=462227 RepID=UPI000A223A0B|nr:putative peptide chain release factor [Babesia sp. Xinjiang]ORM39628.1 putative peptide chain release factor [Babesia sp. Xinjiang]
MKAVVPLLLYSVISAELGFAYPCLSLRCNANFPGFLRWISLDKKFRTRRYPYLETSKEDSDTKSGLCIDHIGRSRGLSLSFAHEEGALVAPETPTHSGSVGDDTLLRLRRVIREKHGEEYPLREYYIKGTGPGGQKVNKSSNCVQLIRFSPALGTNIVVKCHMHRSLLDNRIEATRILLRKLDEAESAQSRYLSRMREKEKRRILKLTPAEKARKKFEKQLRAEKKANRRKWKIGEDCF